MYILKFETWKVVLLFKYSNCKMTYFIKIDKIQEYENKRVEFRLNRIPNCLMSFNQKLDNDRDSLKRIQAKQSYLHNFQEFNWNPKLMSFVNLVILYFPRTDKKIPDFHWNCLAWTMLSNWFWRSKIYCRNNGPSPYTGEQAVVDMDESIELV